MQKIFETIHWDVIDTFKWTTPAVNYQFVEKIQIGTSKSCHKVSYKVDMSVLFFQVTPFFCPMFRKFAQ